MWRIRIRQSMYLFVLSVGIIILDVYGLGRAIEPAINDSINMFAGAIFALLTYGVKE